MGALGASGPFQPMVQHCQGSMPPAPDDCHRLAARPCPMAAGGLSSEESAWARPCPSSHWARFSSLRSSRRSLACLLGLPPWAPFRRAALDFSSEVADPPRLPMDLYHSRRASLSSMPRTIPNMLGLCNTQDAWVFGETVRAGHQAGGTGLPARHSLRTLVLPSRCDKAIAFLGAFASARMPATAQPVFVQVPWALGLLRMASPSGGRYRRTFPATASLFKCSETAPCVPHMHPFPVTLKLNDKRMPAISAPEPAHACGCRFDAGITTNHGQPQKNNYLPHM